MDVVSGSAAVGVKVTGVNVVCGSVWTAYIKFVLHNVFCVSRELLCASCACELNMRPTWRPPWVHSLAGRKWISLKDPTIDSLTDMSECSAPRDELLFRHWAESARCACRSSAGKPLSRPLVIHYQVEESTSALSFIGGPDSCNPHTP